MTTDTDSVAVPRGLLPRDPINDGRGYCVFCHAGLSQHQGSQGIPPTLSHPPSQTCPWMYYIVHGEFAPVWRCFHCDEVFTDHDAAMDHFGASEHDEAACRVDGGLAYAYRNLEAELRRYRDEDTDLHRALFALGSEAETKRRAWGDKEYAAGLDAGRKAALTDDWLERLRDAVIHRYATKSKVTWECRLCGAEGAVTTEDSEHILSHSPGCPAASRPAPSAIRPPCSSYHSLIQGGTCQNCQRAKADHHFGVPADMHIINATTGSCDKCHLTGNALFQPCPGYGQAAAIAAAQETMP